MKKIILSVFLFLTCIQIGFSQELSTIEAKADSLYNSFSEMQALEAYQDVLDQDSTNFEALWKVSFLYSRIGNQKPNKETQREYYEKAKRFAERALAIDSTHSQPNFVMGVAMGRMALVSGTKEKVAASRDIKKYADLAVKYDSTNAGAWHLLGSWNLKVANLSFLERLAANTLFGGVPGDASNQKAVDHIKRAIKLDNRFVLYYHDLAKAYSEMGNEEEAIQACSMALEKENLNPKDEGLKAECREWIKKWK